MIKPKEKSLSILIKEADKLFSEIVRRSDSHNGFSFDGWINCPICDKNVFWKDADAAHVFDRDNMATRYDELNVWGACRECNRVDPDHREKFKAAIKAIIGDMEFECLEERSHSLQKYTRSDLIDLISAWKLELKELRKQKL